MTLYYESSDGQIIDFMNDGIYAQEPETLNNNEWQYTTISGINGVNKIKRFYKDAKTYSLTLDIMLEDQEEFNQVIERMHAVFDNDVRHITPGRIWWNGWYKEAYIISSVHSDFDEIFESITKKLTILSLCPQWIKESTFRYMPSRDEAGSLDYGMEGIYSGFDYDGYDYGIAEIVEIVTVTAIDSANFKLLLYGPVSDPTVTIGNHRYSLSTKLAAGEYAVVDSRTKKIRKYDQYGREDNIFHTRDRDSYIFEKLPAGDLPVLRAKNLSFDITVYDERGEPEWI